MTANLHQDLHLLDLLDSLSQGTRAPTVEQLTQRLAELCRDQRIEAAPDQIHQAAALYLEQQQTDQKLVGLLRHLPAATTAQASAVALLKRLEQACQEQQVTVSPSTLNRAVALFQEQQKPFTLWARPATEQERKEALALYARKRGLAERVWSVFFMALGAAVVAATLALLGAMAHMAQHVAFIKSMFGVIMGCVFMGAMGSILIIGMFDASNFSVPWRYRKWFPGGHNYERIPLPKMAQLQAISPDVKRLKSWMEDPQAKAALKLLSKTAVVLTELDAARLDDMVQQTRAKECEAQQEKDAQLWAEGMRQLRESNG